MNSKTLIFLVIALTSSFTIVVIGVFAIYSFRPDVLGYPTTPPDSAELVRQAYMAKLDSIEREKQKLDTIFIEPRIALSNTSFDSIQQEFLKKDILRIQKDSLLKTKIRLVDSLTRLNRKIFVMKDSVRAVIDTFRKKDNKLAGVRDSLKKYTDMYNKINNELKTAKEKLKKEKNGGALPDSLKEKEFREYAKIYNNSRPESVAKILENLKADDASMIIKFMDKKKAGKVLEVLKPEQAAAILLSGKRKSSPNN